MIKNIFPIKIYRSKYLGNLEELKKHVIPNLSDIFDLTEQNNQGSMRHNGLCSYNVCNDLSNHVDLYDLESFVQSEANNFWNSLHYSKNGCKIYQTWANTFKPGSFIDAHNHSPIPLTASFYLQKPYNSGNLIFENPQNLLLKHQPYAELRNLSNYHTLFDHTVDVEEGDLVIFPGYLNHKTSKNCSSQERIIIGFNIVAS